jgi:hypothetical protein
MHFALDTNTILTSILVFLSVVFKIFKAEN